MICLEEQITKETENHWLNVGGIIGNKCELRKNRENREENYERT